jgi:hypothetical protein
MASIAQKKSFYGAVILFFLLGTSSLLSEAGSPEITVSADKTEMRIGDTLKVEVSALSQKDVELVFPETPGETGEFSFVSSDILGTGFMKEKREGRIYSYRVYETGTHVVPPVKVLYRRGGDPEWKSVLSAQVPVEVISLLEDEPEDIRDIKGLFSRSAGVISFILWLSAVLVVAALVFFWMRKRRKAAMEEALKARPADEIAYEKLRELKAMRLPEKGLIKEYYIRLSDIVRYYLEARFSFRAPEMTTEEFLESLRDSSKLKIEHKELLREFLSHCDMVKFAKYGPTPLEMLDSFSAAERLIDQTRPTDEEGGKEE